MITIDEIKNISQEFFRKGGFEVCLSGELKTDEGLAVLAVETDDPRSLIGPKGETLLAAQHILAQIIRRKIESPLFLDLDINSYKKKRTEFLRELARDIADQVALSQKPVTFEPMRAYERRIMHMELSSRTDIRTASVGEEPERCIQVVPYSQDEERNNKETERQGV